MKINANANDKVDKNENECILLKINGSEFVWVKAMNMYKNGNHSYTDAQNAFFSRIPQRCIHF